VAGALTVVLGLLPGPILDSVREAARALL
jgi:hypothetical protein